MRPPTWPAPTDLDEDPAALDLGRVGLEVHTRRRTQGAAVTDVEAAVVFGAFDDAIHQQAVAKVNALMRAQAVGGVDLVLDAVDRIAASSMVEAHHVLVIDVVEGAGGNPLRHVHVLVSGGRRMRPVEVGNGTPVGRVPAQAAPDGAAGTARTTCHSGSAACLMRAGMISA